MLPPWIALQALPILRTWLPRVALSLLAVFLLVLPGWLARGWYDGARVGRAEAQADAALARLDAAAERFAAAERGWREAIERQNAAQRANAERNADALERLAAEIARPDPRVAEARAEAERYRQESLAGQECEDQLRAVGRAVIGGGP